MPAINRRLLANFILFQAAWFAAVLAPLGFASALAALALVLHFRFVALPREWRFIALATTIGSSIDSLLAASGVFVFTPAHTWWQLPIAPLWLVLLWANFAATLCHSLAWLQRFKLAAFLLGGIAGPATYLGGAALSSKLTLAVAPSAFIALSAPCWAVLAVALPQLAQRMCRQPS